MYILLLGHLKFQNLISLAAGDPGGHKVVRVGRPATENIVVIHIESGKGALDHASHAPF